MALTEYRVWDRTQRVFHWVNFLAVLTLAAIGTVILNADRLGIPDDPGLVALKTVHVYVGYVFILNLLWRLVWAFVGGPFARWRALLPGGPMFSRRLGEFVRGFLGGHAPFYLGHNPLARIFLTVLVLLDILVRPDISDQYRIIRIVPPHRPVFFGQDTAQNMGAVEWKNREEIEKGQRDVYHNPQVQHSTDSADKIRPGDIDHSLPDHVSI